MITASRTSKASLFVVTLLPLFGLAQTNIQGAVTLQGGLQVNSPYSHNVQIMLLSPPPNGSSDYNSLRANVMTQPSVDGVTLNINWSSVEQSSSTNPSSTACTPVNSETCQLDSVGLYHTYDWSNYTGRSGIDPWFDPFLVGGVSTPKKVNFILSSINAGGLGTDTATPWYITSSTTYLAKFSGRQDVLNAIKDCPSPAVPWTGTGTAGPNAATFNRALGSYTVTVSAPGCCSTGTTVTAGTISSGDMIWVGASTADSSFQNISQYGTPATVTGSDTFTYQSLFNTPSGACNSCFYISTGQSSPVPYEQPYLVAWEAFMAAANLHFYPGFQVLNASHPPANVTVGSAGTNQLGYIRSGTWSGGESFVYCITGGSYGGLEGMSDPFIPNLDNTNTWIKDYTTKVNYVESLSPTMMRYWPIDTIAGNNWYADNMAAAATAAGNGYGYVNGFGSQGLSLLDYQNGCSGAIADWCNLFTITYRGFGMPLELQQISISNPDIGYGSCNSSNCGTPPKYSGDLRQWLPFAVNNGATVIEMYYQDLGLAFDPSYCTNLGVPACSGSSLACYVPASSNISLIQECTWFTEVGQAGDGSYASKINAAHGPH